jgi:transglutaminase-like putative cysteine protease
MMKVIYSIVILLVLAFSAKAGDPKYPVSEIPEELKKDVNAVVREDKIVFKILAQNKATSYEYFAVTIFNKNAEEFATSVQSYDKLTKIINFSGSVYDATGKLIKKLKNNEIYDQAVFDGFSLFSDDRIKRANLEQSTYPYTVVYEIETEYKYLYHIDGSVFIPDEKVSVQKASYELIYPPSLTPRFKTFNFESKPIKSMPEPGLESLLWTFENLKPVKFESLGRVNDILPRIIASPGNFEYDGYVGNMSTWDDYGKWQLSLNKGRDVLSETTKQKVRELTKNLTTIEDKTRVLYEFLQSRTRYVSIQLGIGGLQPFEASVVDETGYGDCKALSNYMITLLKEAGVKGYYTIIYGGETGYHLSDDFPSHQFNHVIASVPNGKDTIWLECTDQINPFNYQGRFTGDRKAFIISETGSKIVNTLKYTAEQNVQSRTADVFVEANGNAKAKVKTTYAGLQYENNHLNFKLGNNYDDQRKWLQENMGIPSFDINSFSMLNKKEKIPSAVVNVDLTLNRLATVSGKRIFLIANLMNRSTYMPEKVENRKTKFYRKMTYVDLDTIRYHLPEELYPEYLPEPAKLSSLFGEYETKYSIDQGSLLYIRRVKMNKGEFPPEAYQELIDFYKSVNRADNVKIVFLNKT